MTSLDAGAPRIGAHVWRTDRRSRFLEGGRRRPPVWCLRSPRTSRRVGDEPRYRTARRVRSATSAEPDRSGVDRRRPPERSDRTAMSAHRAPLRRRPGVTRFPSRDACKAPRASRDMLALGLAPSTTTSSASWPSSRPRITARAANPAGTFPLGVHSVSLVVPERSSRVAVTTIRIFSTSLAMHTESATDHARLRDVAISPPAPDLDYGADLPQEPNGQVGCSGSGSAPLRTATRTGSAASHRSGACGRALMNPP